LGSGLGALLRSPSSGKHIVLKISPCLPAGRLTPLACLNGRKKIAKEGEFFPFTSSLYPQTFNTFSYDLFNSSRLDFEALYWKLISVE
jgi:hypothetical protein